MYHHRLCHVLLLTFVFLSGCNLPGVKPTEEQQPEETSVETADLKFSESLSESAEDWFQKGNEYLDNNEPSLAIDAYSRALQLDKTHIGSWHNLGLIYLQRATIAFENLVKQSTNDTAMKQRGEYVLKSMERILQEGFQ